MGWKDEVKKAGSKFARESRRAAKYTLAAGGAMMGGSAGAKAGYQIGSMFDDRKPQSRQTGTDLGKLRSEATANGFNPLTVLRATGGQGFYRDQVPMGRLSSDAFFNAFDAYDNYKNKNTSVIEPNYNLVEGKGKLQDIMDNNRKLNTERNIGREIIPGPIEYDVFQDGDGNHKSTKITGLLRQIVDHHGVMRNWPADPEEMNFITGGLFWTAAELDYQFGKLLNWRNSLGRKDNIPMSEISKKVNKQKVNKKYLHTPILQREPNYGERIYGVPINQQQHVMEQFP